jgi:DNA-directed RNA polymerase subunit H (RpoH/RPB5)
MNNLVITPYLSSIPSYEYEGLSFKIITVEKAAELGIKVELESKINEKDPQIKELKLPRGTIIATFRDYEKEVDPYYSFRVVQQ